MPAPDSTPPFAAPRRAPLVNKKVSRRVKLIDRAADIFVRTSGIGIVVIVALIFVFIGMEALPLFRPAQQQQVFREKMPGFTAPEQVLALGLDEYESHLYYVDGPAGVVRFIEAEDRAKVETFSLATVRDPAPQFTVAYRTPTREKIILGTADGRLVIAAAKFQISYDEHTGRTVKPGLSRLGQITAFADGQPVRHAYLRQNANGDLIYAAVAADGQIVTGKFIEDEPPEDPLPVGGQISGNITGLIVDYENNRLFVATDSRKLYQWYLDYDREAPFRVYDLTSPVTALEYLIGDTALLMGFADGRVESWFGVREAEDDVRKPIQLIHSFQRLPAAVTRIQPSGRDKGFVVGAADGTVNLNFSTSERTLLRYRVDGPVQQLAYSPKLTALLALDTGGRLDFRTIDNPHPEISFKALFGKLHYEGYDEPDYVWQSTGGTDDFEAKFSLVPLIIGTLKGAFYGLLFAIPVAVFAALYTSQFMHPSLRAFLKPLIEIMAALPSVVIGFLAGLWLAPLLEQVMVGTMLLLLVGPVVVLAGAVLWNITPRRWRERIPTGRELVLIVPLVLLGFLLAQWLGPLVEATLFRGDYKQWVFDVFGQQFEQRNSIVIGIAMGFAVIPIIFTISEDAFSNVPPSFKSASYALGASRWQTAWRVIVPTASPGVFSAVMIGFGRAVGETMIVLMATGNTPILSFSPFNGMRTLSANIAVEIPEAPVAGTLYRVLFIAALLLFILTFACNTIAEVVRQRLRERYQAV
jgi:phosphate transport system permease protein